MMSFSAGSLLLQEYDPSRNAPQLFLGRPTYWDMAGYLTDAQVVAIQRKYNASSEVLVLWGHPDTTPYRARVPGPPAGADFAASMEWIVGDALLAQDSPEPGVGAYIGFQLTIRNKVEQRGGPDDFELEPRHAVAFFRFGGKKDGALFFMDSNCGVYHIHPGKLSSFLQAWVKGYEESPFEMTSPIQRVPGKISVVKTEWKLTKLENCFVALALHPPPIGRKPE